MLKSLCVSYSESYYTDDFYYTTRFGLKQFVPVYASIYGYASDIKRLAKNINKTTKMGRFIFLPELHQFRTEYKNDIGHIVVWLKQYPIHSINNRPIANSNIFFLYSDVPRQEVALCVKDTAKEFPVCIQNQLYNVIQEYTGIPCLPSWIPYILRETWNHATSIRDCYKTSLEEKSNIYPIMYTLDDNFIKNVITNGIVTGALKIPGSDGTCSEKLSRVATLDDYLNEFSSELSNKVQRSFVPLFNPSKQKFDKPVDQFYNMAKYRKKIDLLHDQQSVINAVCKRLDNAYSAIIVGNMGSGKSIMSIGSVYAHSKMHNKKYTNNIVLCPGHLVNKWKREIQDSYPCSEVIICNDFNQFVYDIEPILNDKNRKTNLFIIISKDTAKGEFEEQPIVHSKPADYNMYEFTCPSCGRTFQIRNSSYLTPDTFARKNTRNSRCPFCNETLWVPALGKNSRYIKIPGIGWFEKNVMHDLYVTRYKNIDPKSIQSKTERKLMHAVVQYHDDNTLFAAPLSRKYSIAKYIYRKYRNKIDYFIGDEIHQYSASDSEQGKAFSLLVRSAKHTIGLTGTLMNGYASNLFYLLFRMFSKKMVKAGYLYNDCKRFMRKYGVVETKKMTTKKSSSTKTQVSTKVTERPGVSPVVFTDFLLNSCVFISLEYSSSYSEIPVSVTMDEDMRANYDTFCDTAKTLIDIESDRNKAHSDVLNFIKSSRGKMLMQAVNQLTLYPDQPYDMDPIRNEDTNKIVAKFTNIDDKERMLPKEEKTLELIKKAVDRGEHVLIYMYWTNKTNCQSRLKKLIREKGYNVDILTNEIPSKKREAWIYDKVKNGMQVLICNPTLVETGLDLLDFTTIIFYQLGYKLTTMRQASRRSYRLNQKNPVHVYFLYYKDTAQEQALAIMSLKLKAATALEGNFSSEGLAALNSDDTDILGQLAKSIVNDDKYTIDSNAFKNTSIDENTIKIVQNEELETDNFVDVFNMKKFVKHKKRNLNSIRLTSSAVCW